MNDATLRAIYLQLIEISKAQSQLQERYQRLVEIVYNASEGKADDANKAPVLRLVK